MFFPFKVFLPVIAAPMLGVALLGTVASAEDAMPASGRLDQLQTQIDGLKSKLQVAQGYGRPPGNVGGAPDDYYGNGQSYNSPSYGGGGQPAQDAASLDVRMTHIENEIRQINGQIEQMQFAEHKLEDALKKFQQDVDFRFQDTSGHGGAVRTQKRTDASDEIVTPPSPAPSPSATAATDAPSVSTAPLRTGRRGDAFDPASDPNAPGAPRQLGSIASSATALPPPESSRSAANNGTPSIIAEEDESDPNAPLDLSSGRRRPVASSTPSAVTPGLGTAAAPRQIPLTPQAPSSATPAPTQVATAPVVASPKDEFDSALGYFKQKEYETAEKSFSAFLQKNPKSRMTPDAIYYLGETYYQRGRQREAAEQYLKISTDYSTSGHAPEAMLRLGQSLNAIGAKEQACASFDQVAKKYPNAQAWIKTGAEREASRAKC